MTESKFVEDRLINFGITANGSVSKAFIERDIRSFQRAASYVRDLKYKRTSDPSDPLLVLIEERGTCSSKHALLAKLADENHRPILLTVGFFEMSGANTPGVGKILKKFNLPSVLEAHCYLKYKDERFDYTRASTSDRMTLQILHEETLSPDQIGPHKVALHRAKLATWLTNSKIPYTLEQAWQIREECILAIT